MGSFGLSPWFEFSVDAKQISTECYVGASVPSQKMTCRILVEENPSHIIAWKLQEQVLALGIVNVIL